MLSAVAPPRPMTAEQLVALAQREKARLIVSSYNEPLITAEWAVEVFRQAKPAGLACAFVSNGNATPEVLDFLRPWLTSYKVDLKSFDDRRYRTLGGTLDAVLRSIRMVHERGLWLEVVTLVIPGFNDAQDELRRAADFLASVSRDIPWHVTAFHKDYRMTDPEATPAETLIRACEIGRAAGLRFVYAGNLPGRVGPWEDTTCPFCGVTLIARHGYLVRAYRITADGGCPDCGRGPIPGVWPGSSAEVRTGNDLAAYRSRLPRAVGTMPPLVPVHRKEGVGRSGAPSYRTPSPPTILPGGPPTMPTQELASAVQDPVPPPPLTAEEKQQVVTAAVALLRATVAGQASSQQAVPEHTVAGTFVSLKRGGHLRACCGLLGMPTPLAQALAQATYRTAWEDVRFPTLSPAELEYLDLEVWLLYNPVPVQARGEERVRAITVGRHGIQVVRGEARGLFLPGVAVENNWDARRFLDQVCVKAGLPPTAWRDDGTALFTFEGEALRAPVGGARTDAGPPGTLPAGESAGLRQPVSQQPRCPAHRRHAQLLPVRRSGRYRHWRRAEPASPRSRLDAAFQPNLAASGPALAGDAVWAGPVRGAGPGEPGDRGRGIQRARGRRSRSCTIRCCTAPSGHRIWADWPPGSVRSWCWSERGRRWCSIRPARPTNWWPRRPSRRRVTQPAGAAVFSLVVVGNGEPLTIATAPQPVRGPAERPAAVAGSFYEADPAALARTVDALLAGERRPEDWPAALVPHAGLHYSGRLAADVLRRLKIPKHVIVIGPKHTPLGMEWAVAPHQSWLLPGGSIASDFVLARKLCQAIPGLELDAAAHQREHAIEVELPLLARLAPDCRVLGIAIGHADLPGCRRFAEGLADLLRGLDPAPLLLISSDMNHFATDAETRRLDALALQALERRDPETLYRTVHEHSISMCGVLPAVIVLETLRLLGRLKRTERVGYATTADVTGDTSRVVGYAGMLFG